MLLVAFLLNLTGVLASDSRIYHALNAVGAAISCYASYMIGFRPFVVLEASWAAVALFALMRGVRVYRGLS
jgi:hypothetical protein